jgi:hypothetical protein
MVAYTFMRLWCEEEGDARLTKNTQYCLYTDFLVEMFSFSSTISHHKAKPNGAQKKQKKAKKN